MSKNEMKKNVNEVRIEIEIFFSFSSYFHMANDVVVGCVKTICLYLREFHKLILIDFCIIYTKVSLLCSKCCNFVC